MRLPRWAVDRLSRWADAVIISRAPDFVIGTPDNPYMRRWWVIPRNRWFNIYLHEILRSDDDRALHDHPWLNTSILIAGAYREHSIRAGGINVRRDALAGDIVMRRPTAAHRLEISSGGTAISLFLTGPVVRHWGFHCPEAGWRHWKDFTAPNGKGLIGRGCGELDPADAAPLSPRLFDSSNPRRG